LTLFFSPPTSTNERKHVIFIFFVVLAYFT
jgi:hypothetical protein